MLLSCSLFSVHPGRVMRKFFQLLAVFPGLFALPLSAQAEVRITVDLSSQQMEVRSDNGASYSWPISSARAGYVTPNGVYSAVSLQTMHRSKKYHNSPMPHSIFFHGGYAIHGTYDLAELGRPASHGCVRISPAHAATLYALVQAEGATIHVVGSPANEGYARRTEPQDDDMAPRPVDTRPIVAHQAEARRRVAQARPARTDDPFALIFGFGAPSQPAAQARGRY